MFTLLYYLDVLKLAYTIIKAFAAISNNYLILA